MENPWAGEVTLTLDGAPKRLKLTLGALAALEAQLEASSLVELVNRFETGQFSTQDMIGLLHAGLQGGGWAGTRDALLDADIEGGMTEATRVSALLLARAFALPVVSS